MDKRKKTFFSWCIVCFTASFVLVHSAQVPRNFLQKKDLRGSHPQYFKLSQQLQHYLLSCTSGDEPVKIWVYFRDKGISSQSSLHKKLEDVRQSLDPHCLWRRSKVRGGDQLVDYDDIPPYQPYTEAVESMVFKVRTASRWLNALSVEASRTQVIELIKHDFVQEVDLVSTFHRDEQLLPEADSPPRARDEAVPLNYGNSYLQLNQINVIPLHQLGLSGQRVRVCLLDTGFRKSHEVFQHAPIVAEWDFVNGDTDVAYDPLNPQDYSDSHGTGTWSLLGGYRPGQLIGPAYGAEFILGKTETTRFEDQIEEDYWAAGIEWAESLGAEVVSSSLGYTDWYTFQDLDGQTAVTTKAANRAVELGVVVVNATGNDRDNEWGHIIAPSDGFFVIAVGAVDAEGEIASFSSPGPTSDGRIKPEVCALGVDNWLAGNTLSGADTYIRGDGTSFATPLVAGVAALILEAHRDWTPHQVYAALLNTASRSSEPDNDYGWGIVNAYLAASLEFALLKLNQVLIDDDTSGGSIGNGNGVAELGETLEVKISLENKSRVSATTPHLKVSSPNTSIQVLQSDLDLPSIPPSASRTSLTPTLVKIPAFFRGHHLILRVEITGPNTITRTESFLISVSRS